MDDEEDRHLLDILGDVDALNDYLHGSNSKSIEEDDVTNAAAYGSDGSLFANNAAGSNSGLKEASSVGQFGEDSAGEGLQLSGSLSFIEDELGPGSSPGGVDLGGEDQPFDILQKSLMEADITEQTLAQEALLDSQAAPTLVQAPAPFPSQVVSGSYGGGVVTTAGAAFTAGHFLQGVSQLPNGSAQHIQVLGSFGTASGVMTLSNLERPPQIVLRPGTPVPAAGTPGGGQVYAPTPGQIGQVGLPFKNIPLQNIIIQRGPGGTQTLVRPIQPKPLQAGAQTVYSLGLQPANTTIANVLSANAAAPSGQYTTNGSIVVHPPLEQQQQQQQPTPQAPTGLAPGQFLLPGSLALTPASSVHSGSAESSAGGLVTSQGAVQIVAGQNFSAAPGGPLILNPRVVAGSQAGVSVTQTWTGVSCASSTPAQGRLTLVGPSVTGVCSQGQVAASPVQRLLVTQSQKSTTQSPLPGAVTAEQQDFRQNSSSPAIKQECQVQLSTVHVSTTSSQEATLTSQTSAQKRPAPPPPTKGGMTLQQLRRDHAGVQNPDRRRFASIDEALQRLLPYHVFQGAPSSLDEFSQVDEEFEAVATQVLKRTQSMVNKYRRLLLVEAERFSPSSEMVMIDRTFNQEERSNLTQDKRMVLVDPDGFLEDFCCGTKSKLFREPSPPPPPPPPRPSSSCGLSQSDWSSSEPPYRTDSQPGYGDPGGGGAIGTDATLRLHPLQTKGVLELKQPSSTSSTSSLLQGNSSPFASTGAHTHYQGSHHHHHLSSQQPQYPPPSPPSHPDSDSALEAAVNSILEC